MKRFKIYKLNLDGSRVTEHPNFQYDAEQAQPNQPEWGLLERIKPEGMCSEEEKATALEVIDEVKPGYTVPAYVDQFGVEQPERIIPDLVFKRYRLRQMFEVVEIDLDNSNDDEAFNHRTQLVIQERKKRYKSAEEVIDLILDKGINSQELQEYKDERTAIKAQFPKPTRGGG